MRNWTLPKLLAVAAVVASRAWGQDFCVGDGVVLADPSTQDAQAIAIDAGSLYVAGYDSVPGNGEWRIEKRSLSEGALAPAFGNLGVVTSNPTFNWELPRGVAVDSSFLYAVGYDGIRGLGAGRWRVEKRDISDGALAAGFGSGGVVTTGVGAGSDQAAAIVTDASFMYVAGYGDGGWRIEKRNLSDGALVTGFGTGGAVTSPGGEAFAIAMDGGSLYVAGSDDFESWRIEKRNAFDGALLYAVTETFPDIGCGPQGVFAIAIDAGAMYAAGEAAGEWRIEKRNLPNGALVYSKSLPESGSCDAARGIAIDGVAMYVVGQSDYQWRIEKRNLSDGMLIPTFGASGAVGSDAFFNGANAIAIDAGAMYVVGSDTQWRIEKRDLADGALLPCVSGSPTPTPVAQCAPVTLSDCKVRVRGSKDRFVVNCNVTLGGASDGIDPAQEGVRLLLTDADSPLCSGPCFAETVRPVRAGRCWRYKQTDPAASGLRKLKLCDVDPARGVYRLTARARRTDLQCLNGSPPYAVGVTIGNDCSPVCGGPGTATPTPDPTPSPTPSASPGGCHTITRYPSVVLNAPGSRQWQDPINVTANDSIRAVVPNLAPSEVSDSLLVNNLGFALPYYARVTGIKVEVKRASDLGTAIEDESVTLRLGQFERGSKAAPGVWGTVEGYVAYGGSTDSWGGYDWTPEEVNSPDFGVGLVVHNSSTGATDTARVDHIRVTVYYVTASSVVGPRNPTAAVDDASIGTRAWTAPGGALAAGGSEATVSAMVYPQVTHYLRVSGFGFSGLPAASPSGILLEVKRSSGFLGFAIADNAVRLVKNGQIGSTDRSAGAWDTTSAYHAYGGPNDLWGTTWSPTELSSPAFGAAISADYPFPSGNDTASVDHVRMTILYGAFATQTTESPSAAISSPNSDDWYDPQNATAEDGSTALVRLVFGTPSSFLAATGFGFALPATAQVNGITLGVTRAARDPDTIYDHAVRLIKGGLIRSVDRARADSWDPAYSAVEYGGPTDLWGESWTAADVNDPTFGAALQTHYTFFSGNNDAGVDSISITVDYCE